MKYKGGIQTFLMKAHQWITSECAGKAVDLLRHGKADAVHMSVPELKGSLSKTLNLQTTAQKTE